MKALGLCAYSIVTTYEIFLTLAPFLNFFCPEWGHTPTLGVCHTHHATPTNTYATAILSVWCKRKSSLLAVFNFFKVKKLYFRVKKENLVNLWLPALHHCHFHLYSFLFPNIFNSERKIAILGNWGQGSKCWARRLPNDASFYLQKLQKCVA